MVVEASQNEPFGKCLKSCLSIGLIVLALVFATIVLGLILWVTPPDYALAFAAIVALGCTSVLGMLWYCLIVCGIESFVRSLLPGNNRQD